MARRKRRRGKGRGRKNRGLQVGSDLTKAQGFIDQFGLAPELTQLDTARPQELIDLIGGRQDIYDTAGVRSDESTQGLADQNEFLALLKGGLNGRTDQERGDVMERGERSLDQNLLTAQRGFASQGAARGVRGAAAGAGARDLIRDRQREQSYLLQDVRAEDEKIKTDRRAAYGDALGNRDDLLNLFEKNEFDRRNDALGNLETMTGAALKREDLLRNFNASQEAATLANKNNNLLGMMGVLGNRRGTRQAKKLQMKQLELQQANYEAQLAAIENASNNIGGIG